MLRPSAFKWTKPRITTALTSALSLKVWLRTGSPPLSGRWVAASSPSRPPLRRRCCSRPGPYGCPGAASAASPADPAPACAPCGCAWTGPHSLSFFCENRKIHAQLLKKQTNKKTKKQDVLTMEVLIKYTCSCKGKEIIDLIGAVTGYWITWGGALHTEWTGVKCKMPWRRFYNPDFGF